MESIPTYDQYQNPTPTRLLLFPGGLEALVLQGLLDEAGAVLLKELD